MSIPYALGPVLLAVAFAWGQETAPAPASPARAPAAMEAKSPDAVLQEEIEACFARSKIAEDNFRVRVLRGVAILNGRTSVVQRKGTATRLARLAGAAKVDNRIEITQRKAPETVRGDGRSSSRTEKAEPRRVRVQWP